MTGSIVPDDADPSRVERVRRVSQLVRSGILFLNSDGTVKSQQKISSTNGGFTGDLQGTSVALLDDLDSDGVRIPGFDKLVLNPSRPPEKQMDGYIKYKLELKGRLSAGFDSKSPTAPLDRQTRDR